MIISGVLGELSMKLEEIYQQMAVDAKANDDELVSEESEKRRLEKLSVEEVVAGLVPDWMDSAYEEGSIYRMPCIFHQNVRTPRGTLALDFFNDRFNCHSCQAGGTGGFNFARNMILREMKGDFSQIHISQEDYVNPEVLNRTFKKLGSIEPVYLSEQQKNERKRIMETNLAKENIRKKKGRTAAFHFFKNGFPFPSGPLLEKNPRYKNSAAYKWGTTGQKPNCVDYSIPQPNIKITNKMWRGYENPNAVGCIIAPLMTIDQWEDTFLEYEGIIPNSYIGSVHLISVDKHGEKAFNLNVDKLAKKDNKYKIGRKWLDTDSSVFMLEGYKDRNKLIICEGLGDALALQKIFDCYVMAPIGVIGKLSKHSEEIIDFCRGREIGSGIQMGWCINEIWLMPDNDAGLNMLSRFMSELRETADKMNQKDIVLKQWILGDQDKKHGLDPAEVVANLNYDAKEIFERNLVEYGKKVKHSWSETKRLFEAMS